MRALLTSRLSRAGFGLLAIWCLGCTSFDVVLDALLRGETTRAGCVMEGDSAAPAISAVSTIGSRSTDDPARGCGCDHCVAVQTRPTDVAVIPHVAPETVHHKLGSALSVSREPLVRPPIALIAI